MVRWYNPILLLRIGFRAASATLVEQFSDHRELQAALDPIDDDSFCGAYDRSESLSKTNDSSFCIDYVADLGEGWDATYTVASALSAPDIKLQDQAIARANLLIFGGDQVYPDPSSTSYQERTIHPYCKARESFPSFQAELFALPGNHDWYDGLAEFTNLFCRARSSSYKEEDRKIANWVTNQRRSYFAIKLPQNWWLCGIDVQLGHTANITQIDYFRKIAENLIQKNDKIILCSARPEWVLSDLNQSDSTESLTQIIEVLSAMGAEVKAVLAGDIHHYSHYKTKAGKLHCITAGGGGSFLHPTHHLPEQLNAQEENQTFTNLNLEKCYPEKSVSRKLTYKNFIFPFLNWDFSILIGCIYTLLAWFFETRTMSTGAPMSEKFLQFSQGNISALETVTQFFTTIPKSPEFAIIVFILYFGFIKFNQTKNLIFSIGLGVAHALAHFAPFIVAYYFAALAACHFATPLSGELLPFILFIGTTFIISSILGGIVFGGYLYVALNWFNLQWNNAFSSLRISNFRNFLRLVIDTNGDLTIHALKIEKIGKTSIDGSWKEGSEPELIETIKIQ